MSEIATAEAPVIPIRDQKTLFLSSELEVNTVMSEGDMKDVKRVIVVAIERMVL